MRRTRLLLAAALALAVAIPVHGADDEAPAPLETPEDLPSGDVTYLRPNMRFANGEVGYVHVTEEHMPLRVAIGKPKRPPKYAGTRKTREVSIEAMQMWEKAIQKKLPWFQLEFVEKDPDAPIQVEWKRRITGDWAGFGRILYREVDGQHWVGGHMEISTTPSNFITLEIDEVRLLVAHEFGHVLGLGHCLDCDSAMNYSWSTRGRVLVTDLDVDTFVELVSKPIGPIAD